MQTRKLIQGSTPLLISMPHSGTYIPADIKRRLTEKAAQMPAADWYIDRLYWFAEKMGVSLLMATHSRFVIDLNRPPDDGHIDPGQRKTGLCPLENFFGEKIYKEGEEPDDIEKINRIAAYWLPYHERLQEELARIKQEFGYAILYDAHSMRSKTPLLFEGELPDLNLGTVNGASCAAGMAEAAMRAASGHGYSTVLDGRFVGGYIPRHYGQPQEHIHALQMELTFKNYMVDELQPFRYDEQKAAKLQSVLKDVLESLLAWGEKAYR